MQASKQLIKALKQLAQNNLLNQLVNIGLHRLPHPLFSCPIPLTLSDGGFYGSPNLPTSVRRKNP